MVTDFGIVSEVTVSQSFNDISRERFLMSEAVVLSGLVGRDEVPFLRILGSQAGIISLSRLVKR